MRSDELAIWGAKLAEWSARYLETLRDRPVRAPATPGATLAQIPSAPPERPEPIERIFADFEEAVLPGITHWQHPRFFAYFPANSSPPSVLAEWLTATLAAQCMLWQTSPAASELETAMMGWLRGMIGLPEAFSGVVQDSASSATLAALLVARDRATGGDSGAAGLGRGAPCRVYCSAEAHSSVERACRVIGIGSEHVVKIAPDRAAPHRPMQADALRAAIAADRAAGLRPAAIVATFGATGVGACDDIHAAADIAAAEGIFLHVDAAWAGSALICPEFRPLAAGIERADSVVFNPHKWLLTNFDCSAHFIREPDALRAALGVKPAYLETLNADGPALDRAAAIDYSDLSVPLGRRFRALKLWFVIRAYGVAELQATIRRHVVLAQEVAARLAAEPDFELQTDPVLSLFSFRHRPEGLAEAALDAHNARLLAAINDDGRVYLTQTRVDGRFVIRFQVGQTDTQAEDVTTAFDVIGAIARRLSA